MTPADLAQRIAALDWSMLPIKQLLAVTAACETLTTMEAPPVSNVIAFPTYSADAERVLLRGCSYVPDRRVCLTLLDGTPFADALCGRQSGAAWGWIVATVVEELRCYPEQVALLDDDTVTVDGMPCYLIA